MNVNCPGCRHSYKLDENRIPPAGQKMRCPKCSTTFRVMKDGTISGGEASSGLTERAPSLPPVLGGFGDELDTPDLPTVADPMRHADLPVPRRDIDDSWGDTFREEADLPTPKDDDLFGGTGFSNESSTEDLFGDPLSGTTSAPAPQDDTFGDTDLPTPREDLFGAMDLPAPRMEEDPFAPDPSAATPIDDDPFAPAPVKKGPIASSPTLVSPGGMGSLRSAGDNDPFGAGLPTAEADDDPFALPAAPKKADPFASVPPSGPAGDPFGGRMPSPADFANSSTLIRPGGMGARTSLPPGDPFDIPSPADLAGAAGGTLLGHRGASMPPSRPSGADFGNIDFSTSGDRLSDVPAAPVKKSATVTKKTGGGADFGQLDLDGSSEESAEFDAFPVQEEDEAPPPKRDTFDLADDAPNRTEKLAADAFGGLGTDPAAEKARQLEADRKMAGAFEGRRKYERQSRKTRALMLGLLALLGIGGGALHFTEHGAFGVNRLIALLPSATSGEVIHQYFEGVIKSVDRDTVADLEKAIAEIDTLRKELPKDEDLRIIGVYLHNLHQLRYGLSTQHEKAAITLLGNINLDTSESRYASIAALSRLIVTEQPKKAIARMKASASPSVNETILLVMAHLRLDQPDEAMKLVESLAKARRTPRVNFLRQLVLVKAGRFAEARQELELLTLSAPNHFDAKLLLARLMVDAKTKETQKVTALLTPINEALDGQTTPSQKAAVHAIMGKLLLQRRKYDKAKEEFAKAKALNPRDIVMLTGEGNIALMSGDVPGAMSAFRNALAEDATDIEARLGMADAHIRQDKLTEARSTVDAVKATHPDRAQAHYLSAVMEKLAGKLDVAEASFKKAISLDAEYIESYVGLAAIYMETDRDLEAMKTLDAASAAVPDSSLIKLTLADGHAANEDYASAIVVLNEALELEPENPIIHFKMAQMYRRMQSIEDAQAALDEVTRLDPRYPGLSVEQGFLMELSGQIEDALKAYEKVLAENPDDLTAKTRAAAASLYQKKYDRAKELLVDVLNQNPDSADGNFYMGEIFRQERSGADAIPYLKNACDLDPHNPLYHVRYGAALALVHDVPRAMMEYQKAIELDPKIAEIYLRIGELRLQSGAARDAITQLEKALALDPKIENAHLLIGQSYEELADLKAAADYYRQATISFPDNPDAFYRTGLSAMRTSGHKAAIPSLKTAVRLAQAQVIKPVWLPEALYHLGAALKSTGDKRSAIDVFRTYLTVAPEDAIDRKEVQASLDDMLY